MTNPLPSLPPDGFNSRLAAACQQCFAACCKKGKIFLTHAEIEAIDQHVATLPASAKAAWVERRQSYGSFSLYDQRDRCQFLTPDNLCSLHTLGIKPHECFWWPYHVYVDTAGVLQIEVSTTCCEGWKHHDNTSAAAFLDAIDEQVAAIGADVFRAFRKVYDGSYGRKPVRPVHRLRWAPVAPEQLAQYRKVGEKFFPEADWNFGMQRYNPMLRAYPAGVQAAWLGDRIIAYLSLWPVREEFVRRFTSGASGNNEFSAADLDLARSDRPGAWFLKAVAIDTKNRELRRALRRHLEELMFGGPRAIAGTRIIAKAVTDDCRRFLSRLGFIFELQAQPTLCILMR